MVVPSSHLPSGSHKGWILVMGEGRQQSTTKLVSASKYYTIWIYSLKAEAGGTVHRGMPNGRSRLWDANLDNNGLYSYLMVGTRGTKASQCASNDVSSASD